MSRWHDADCLNPQIDVRNGLPECLNCNRSPDLASLMPTDTSSTPSMPADEPPGSMNLWWPHSVPYCDDTESSNEGETQVDGNPEVHAATASSQSDSDVITTTAIATSAPSIIYPQSLKPTEIRLAVLSPARSHDFPVHLELEIYDLDDCPDYEAVSYLWGGENDDSTLRCPIYIGAFWDILFQTENCHDMLRFMRPWRGIRMAWVDAVCINQRDLSERSEQVANMTRVYSGGTRVIAYLGSDLAIPLGRKHPRRHSLLDLATDTVVPEFPGRQPPFQVTMTSLLERRYFSRVWIVQEILLSRTISMRVGDVDFWTSAGTSTGFSWSNTAAPWFEHLSKGVHHGKRLLELMFMTSKVEATDPRDGVFGLLGILGPGATQLTANYSLSSKHVFIGLLSHCLLNLGEDHVLLRACGTKSQHGYPSWVPDWRSQETWSRILYGNSPRLEPPDESGFRLCSPPSSASERNDRHFHEYELRGRHISIRPQKRAYICSRTGALHVCLTQYMSIRSQLKWVPGSEGSCDVFSFNTSDFHTAYIFSGDPLDKITFVGNEQIFIHRVIPNCRLTSSSQDQLTYLILRPVEGRKDSFRLIATSERVAIRTFCSLGDAKDCAFKPKLHTRTYDLDNGYFLLSDLQQLEDRSLSKFPYTKYDGTLLKLDGSPEGNWLIKSFFPDLTHLHPLLILLQYIFLTRSTGKGIADTEFQRSYDPCFDSWLLGGNFTTTIESGFVVFQFPSRRLAWRDRQEWERYIHPENVAKGWEFRTKDTDWAVISRSSAISSNEDSPTISSDNWVKVRSPISNLINNLADATSQTKAAWDGYEALQHIATETGQPLEELISLLLDDRYGDGEYGTLKWTPEIFNDRAIIHDFGITGVTRVIRIV